MTNYCNVDDVLNFTHLTPIHFGIDAKKDPTKLNEIINKWILHASSMIDQYTNNPYSEDNIPPVYENVCIRIVANMVASAEIFKNINLTTNDNWQGNLNSSHIFTRSEKDDLEPYVKTEVRRRNASIEFLTVNGNFKNE